MKLKSLFLLVLAALLTLSAPRQVRAAEVSFDFFYDALSPYGEWLQVGDYGLCWKPSNVDEDWAPYSDGYWSYTDAGWTWVSYEEFGGIVYHYGRWAKVEDEGWVWVPDYEWGPAWVSWRKNNDYVGWAPLPAEARFEPERGISVWVDTSYDIGPGYYNFCHTRDFGAPVLRPLIIQRSENIVFIGDTVNITNITYNRHAGCVFNGGLEYAYVNRFQPRPIPALKLVRNTNVTIINNRIVNNNVTINNFNSVQRGNQLTVLAPTVVRPQANVLAARVQPNVTRVIPPQRVTHGWNNVPADRREAVRASFAQQTQGKTPETTAATPVKPEELKFVPVKADPNAKIAAPARGTAKTNPVPLNPTAPGTVTAPGATPTVADPAKIAGGKRGGKGVPPTTAAVPQPVTNPAVEGAPATATPVPLKGGKPVAIKGGKIATPAPVATAIDNPPATVPAPIAKTPGVKPGIVKPFNPPANVDPSAQTNVPTTPVSNPAADKRAAAVEAAKQKAAAQDAARARAVELKQQQQETAAAARSRMLQQQQAAQQQPVMPVQPPIRKAAPVPQVVPQDDSRERAAQAAEAKQRAAAAQQQSQAAAIARQQASAAQAQNAARQQAAAAQAQNAARQQAAAAQAQNAARQQAAAQQQQRMIQQRTVQPQQPTQQPAQRPVAKGKKPLTPEEEAALKKAQGQ